MQGEREGDRERQTEGKGDVKECDRGIRIQFLPQPFNLSLNIAGF